MNGKMPITQGEKERNVEGKYLSYYSTWLKLCYSLTGVRRSSDILLDCRATIDNEYILHIILKKLDYRISNALPSGNY